MRNSERLPSHSVFSTAPRKFHAGDAVILTLISLFSIVSLCVLGASLRMISDPWRKKDWVETSGQMLMSETLRPSLSRSQARVLYRYEFGGREYQSGRTNFGDCLSATATNFASDHPAGSAVPVFVNPGDPSEAVLSRAPSGGWLLLPMAGGTMVLSIWLLRAWLSTRSRDGRRQTWKRAFGSPYLRSRMRRYHRRA